MSNIAPINITKLENMLGGKVTEYFTQGGEESAISFINGRGVEEVATVKKMDLSAQFALASPTVVIDKDATYADGVKAFSDQNGLALIKGVDYDAADIKVDFSAGMVARFTLNILPNSFLYKGSVSIRFVTESGGKLLDSMASLAKTFQLMFFQGILSASRPFECEGKAFNGNQLSPELIKAIQERFGESNYVTEANLDILRNATIFNYQVYRKEGDVPTARVYLRDANRNLLSLAVVPQNDDDRPF